MGGLGTHRLLALGVGASLLVHILAGVVMRIGDGPSDGIGGEPETDIELAPEAEQAHLPQPGPDQLGGTQQQDEQPREPEPEPEPAGTVDQQPEPEEEDEVAVAMDAGVDAAAVALADAGVGDAALVAETDAGAGDDAGTEVALGDAGAGGDGGALAETETDDGGGGGGPGSGTGAVATNEPDPYGGKPPPGATSNLLAYFPPGEKVSVLIRLDRFRGTIWARRLDKILQPMPDYAGLVGRRKMVVADEFESITISSPKPRDAGSTTVMVRHRRTPAQMRAFLGRGGAPVTWKPALGGALGTRAKSPLIEEKDERVFLLPFPKLALLARPRTLGKLASPAQASLDAFPRDVDLPEWVRNLRGIEAESGDRSGPAAIVTVQGVTRKISIPRLGSVNGPDRLTVAMEFVKGGVMVRGNMVFSDEARAAAFVEQAMKWKEFFVGSLQGKLVLAPFHAFNAVKGLTLRRAGRQVGYATSISVADFQAMTDYGAELTRIYFKQLNEEAAAAREAARPPVPRQPGPPPSGKPSGPPAGGPSGPPR